MRTLEPLRSQIHQGSPGIQAIIYPSSADNSDSARCHHAGQHRGRGVAAVVGGFLYRPLLALTFCPPFPPVFPDFRATARIALAWAICSSAIFPATALAADNLFGSAAIALASAKVCASLSARHLSTSVGSRVFSINQTP